MSLNYIPYPGNKTKFVPVLVDLIQPFLNKPSPIFIEPFGGSGTMSLYLASRGIQCFLNEYDKQIYLIHYSFKYGTKKELLEVINEIWSFGDPKNNKEDYYKARTVLNEKYFNKHLIKSGFYNWAISTFAINSMLRFGPHGFNQGWGNRGIENRDFLNFELIQSAYKKISLSNMNFFNLHNNVDNNNRNYIIFMDPPYVSKGSGTYNFTIDQHNKFIDLIKNCNKPIIYTDTFSQERLDKLSEHWNFKVLRETMGSGKPGKSNNKEREVVYYNFNNNKPNKLF